MLDRFQILFSRGRRLVSRDRWSSRLLGHPPPRATADEPGLVLIQVDGLGQSAFRRALREGEMPFLARLIETEGYHLSSMYTGLPSITPGVQAELFYGISGTVPGFRYRDPRKKEVVFLDDPAWVNELEQRFRGHCEGLLKGGAAWSGIFAGGADEVHLSVAGGELAGITRARGRLRLAGLLVWHGWSVLRVLYNMAFTTMLSFRDWRKGRIDRRQLRLELRRVPFRVLVSAVLRELVTAGASVDTERGLPVIHLNFPGFDEYAHRRGPDARSTRWVLKGIDSSIQRVWESAHRSVTRDYQVWVYSDHGHEAVTPYEKTTGHSLPDTVDRVYRWVRDIVGAKGATPPFLSFTPPAVGEDRARALTTGFPAWLGGLEPPEEKEARRERDAGSRGNGDDAVEVVYHGPVAFVYLPTRHDRHTRAWLAEVLAVDGRIPWVLLPDGDGALAFSSDGRFHRLPDEAAAVLGRDHPHLHEAAEDLVGQVRHPGAGDLTLLGWSSDTPLSFQVEYGSHGGPGPLETSGFVMFSPDAGSQGPIAAHVRPRDLRRLALDLLERRPCPGDRTGEDPAVEVAEDPGEAGTGVPAENAAAGASVAIRVMTYNVHGCRGMDGKYAPQRIARVIARENPDIVCLQELDQERNRSGGVDQVAVIANRLRTEYRFHAVAEVDDGRFGNAVLSPHPLRVVEAGPLPEEPRVKDVLSLENRGVLWVAAEIGGGEIQILNTHLSILERERRIQVAALLGPEWLGHPGCRGSVILAGDFNASPESWAMQQLEARLRPAVAANRKEKELRTWSGSVPLRRIDHVLVGEEIEVSGAHVPRTRLSRVASDHLPLVVDLRAPRPGR